MKINISSPLSEIDQLGIDTSNYRFSYYHPSLHWTPAQWAEHNRNERKRKHERPLHEQFGWVQYQAKVKRFR
jgi:hypothetical protein